MSFENSRQILELSTPSCSITPLLIDYGLEAGNPNDINAVSSVNKLTERLRKMRPSIVLYNLLDKKDMKQFLHDISNELHECIKDTGFILVVLDSMSLPMLTKKSRHKIKELKNVEERIFHPGGNFNHYCSMMTNMPQSHATYPLSQTSDRSKNRLAVFAVKLRESLKAYLSDKETGPHRTTPSFSWIRSLRISLLPRSRIWMRGMEDMNYKNKSIQSLTRSPLMTSSCRT